MENINIFSESKKENEELYLRIQMELGKVKENIFTLKDLPQLV